MSLRRSVLRLALIAVLVASACAADPPEETQPSRVEAYDVEDGSRPHDVAPAHDGGVWFTGQRAGFLGHFNTPRRRGRQSHHAVLNRAPAAPAAQLASPC